MSDAHQKILERALHNIANEQKYEDYKLDVTPISTGGANYTSELFLATISAPNKDEIKAFAKVAAVGEKFRSQLPTQIFKVEQYAYSNLAKGFERLQSKHGVPDEHRLVMPKLYGYEDNYLEEVIVFEDLSAQGYDTFNRFQSIDWEYASTAVGELAKLHALSIAFQDDYPDEYEEMTKVFKTKAYEEDLELMGSMEGMLSKQIQLVREENRGRLQTYIKTSYTPEHLKKFYEPHRRPVLVHGDFRMSNIMHKVNEEGKLNIIIIDYQTLHFGSASKDLMYFIFTGSDAEFRRQYYQKLIDHYYQQLTEAMQRLHLNPDKAYPRKEFDEDLKAGIGMGLMFALFALPVVTVATENAPALSEQGMEGMMDLKTSDLCSQRLNEIVDDYIEWGLL